MMRKYVFNIYIIFVQNFSSRTFNNNPNLIGSVITQAQF